MSRELYKKIKACRICGADNIRPILDLGPQPPANSLRSNLREKLPKIPLAICICPRCKTVQLTATVRPDYLFKKYVWVTGTSAMAQDYRLSFYRESLKRCPKRPLFIVEVASNDGTFLAPYQKNGHKVLGIDPARNIAKMANKQGIPTMPEFFGLDIADEIVSRYGIADFVFARNVLPHVADVDDVVMGMRRCMGDTGIGAAEFHYGKVILDELHYDSIYHEHLCYFSIKSFSYLLKKHGLNAFDIIESPINAGNVVLYFSTKKMDPSAALNKMMKEEEGRGLHSGPRWKKFSNQCLLHRERLVSMVRKEREGGARLIGYGASARSSTMLNFCGIGKNYLECIADQNPIKHYKYTAGTDIQILPLDVAFSKKPDTVLLLAWNFKDEVLALLKNRYGFRGRVIIPFPKRPKIIEMSAYSRKGAQNEVL